MRITHYSFQEKKVNFEDVVLFLLDKDSSSPQSDSIMVLWLSDHQTAKGKESYRTMLCGN